MSTPSTSSMSRTLSTHLQNILAHTALVVAERKATADLAALERKALAHTPRGFAAALKRQRTPGPHRRAVLPGLAHEPRDRLRHRQDSLPAQGLHDRPLSGARGPRLRCRR